MADHTVCQTPSVSQPRDAPLHCPPLTSFRHKDSETHWAISHHAFDHSLAGHIAALIPFCGSGRKSTNQNGQERGACVQAMADGQAAVQPAYRWRHFSPLGSPGTRFDFAVTWGHASLLVSYYGLCLMDVCGAASSRIPDGSNS